jgi:hypothetical protein
MTCSNISIIKESIPSTEIITEFSSYFSKSENLIISEYIEIKIEEIIENIDIIMNDKKIGENYEIKGDNFSIIIKPTNSTLFQNQTHIEFDKCEQELRRIYNISNSSIITFFQIEIINGEENSLYNQIKYFTYDEQKNELNLSVCADIDTQIHYSIKNNSKLDISSISNFKNLGIDILNIKDKFFTDLCYSYSDSNNDMILEDRIKYIFQNYSLCEEGCSYDEIDINNMFIVCNCKIQGNENTNLLNITPLLYEQSKEISFFDSNIAIAKCYNLVFSLNNKLNNIGFIIFTLLIFIYIILMICYCVKGIKPVKDYLHKEMIKNGYINSNSKVNETNALKEENDGYMNKHNKLKKNIKTSLRLNKSNALNKNMKQTKRNIQNNINCHNTIRLNKGRNTMNPNSKMRFININNSTSNKILKTKKIRNENLNEDNNFGIIKINLNDTKNYFPGNSNQSLHNYTFKEAIKYDKRNIFRIAYIYLLSKQIIFRTFLQRSPLELFPLRFSLFIFMFSSDLALNALFYFNDNISKKYHYAQNLFLFTFSNNITIIIYSTLLSYFLITLISKLSNSSSAIRNVFEREEAKIKKNKKYKINDKIKKNIQSEIDNILGKFKIKVGFLFLIESILLLFFAYFVTAFCHVYSSTQLSWLFDSFLSILSRLIIELIFAFFYGKLYQISVGSNFETLYKIIICLYDFS